MRNSIVFAVFLSLLALASISLPLMVKVCEAAPEEYSSAMIAELGEAATVLIYTQISATIKIYIPDVNWVPTTEYFLVSVGIAALGSGFL